jgi:hypothetical protein
MIPAERCPNTPLSGAQMSDVVAIDGCRPIVVSTALIGAQRTASISRARRTPRKPILLDRLRCGPQIEIWYCTSTFDQRHIGIGLEVAKPAFNNCRCVLR